jgi:hypothetical protein
MKILKLSIYFNFLKYEFFVKSGKIILNITTVIGYYILSIISFICFGLFLFFIIIYENIIIREIWQRYLFLIEIVNIVDNKFNNNLSFVKSERNFKRFFNPYRILM